MEKIHTTPHLRAHRRKFRAAAASALSVAAMFISASFGISTPYTPAVASAATSLENGANITSASSGDFASASFDQSLKDLAATGANYVSLNVPLYQSNVSSTDLQPDWNAPSAQTLAAAIRYAHSVGLKVMIKFDVYPGDGQWSAYINPSDRTAWFNNYLTTITPYVQAAQANGAEEICIGDELIDMTSASVNSTNTSNWLSLIASVRKMYSGMLTYSANWGGSGWADEKNGIQFWSALDQIGLSAYFNLTGDGSVAQLEQSWASWDASDVAPIAQKWGKPVIFTEIGYMAIQDSYTHPWMWWEGGTADQAQQANDYQALFQYWDAKPYFAGEMLWNWSSNPNAGGPGDNGYTPQGKTAAQVMQQFFTAPASGGSAAPQFSASASVSPSSPTAGQNASFTVNVANSGGAVSGANVDVEIYDASGNRVLQKTFPGADIGANTSQAYSFTWAPPAAGSYTLKVGVFDGSWSQEYYWGNSVASFTTAGTASSGGTSGGGNSNSSSSSSSGSGSSGGPANGAQAIDIWWPSNGAQVSGVQPFKAMVYNLPASDYTMYWQVDGGQLNPMAPNSTDYPHMEASVDVTPWTWRGTGPYVVTFVAKDVNGNVIATASSTIYN